MGRSILINGQAIYDAGVYSKTNVDGLDLPSLSGKGAMMLIGEADGGKPGIIEINAPSEIKEKLVSGDGAEACALAFKKGVDTKVPGGASKIYFVKTNQSTQSQGELSSISLKSTQYGSFTNFISREVIANSDDISGYSKIVKVYYNDGIEDVTVISDPLGLLVPLRLHYTGSESAATVAITDTKLTLVVGSDTHELLFSTYKTMAQLVEGINALNITGLAVTTPNPQSSKAPGTILDRVSAQDIKTAAYDCKMGCYEVLTWLNTESIYITDCTRKTGSAGDVIPVISAKTALTGGTRGFSTNTNFQNGFDSMLNTKVFNIAVLLSEDNQNGSSMTVATVEAQLKAHVRYKNSFTGRKEVMAFCGFSGNFAAQKAYSNSLNDEDIVYLMQDITALGLTESQRFAPWAFAVVMAATQLGTNVAENLTYTKLPIDDIHDPVDFDSSKATYRAEASKNGILIAYKDDNGIIRTNVGLTSRVDTENNGYIKIETRESLLTYAYDLRDNLLKFVGKTRRADNYVNGNILSEANVKDAIEQFSDAAMFNGYILAYQKDTIEANFVGNYLYPRVKVQPIEGTDFIYVVIDAIRIV